ncbi:MAG: hypothetical protein ACQEP4_07175 [Bacillota bacterium]
MKKSIVLIGLMIILSLTITGCSGGSQTEPEDKGMEADNPASQENPIESEEPQEEESIEDEPQENLLSAAYADIMKGNKYTMKYRTITTIDGQEYDATVTTAVDGDNFATVFDSELAKSTTVQKDGKLYMVMHEQKMVMVFPEDTDQASEFTEVEGEVLDTDEMVYSESGTAEFMGESRRFEEYALGEGTMRYFFDDNNLVGIEISSEGLLSQWVIEEITDSVDTSLFEIPKDYTIFEP